MEEGKLKKLVPIGEAAKFLDVSVDTIRRWDSQGTLHSSRPNGKDRYFSLNELEQVKFAKPLQISEAAERLGISETTLRRLEEKGMITPERNSQDERIYTRECLKKFLDSDYYLRQKEIENKILEPEESEETEGERKERLFTQKKIINTRLEEQQQKITRLVTFRNVFYATGLFLATIFIVSICVIAVLFLLYPAKTARYFGYRIPSDSRISQASKQVLGAEYNPNNIVTPKNVLAKILKPVSQISLGVVKEINADTYYQVIPKTTIDDVNDVLAINSENEVSTRYNFTFPDTSYLVIPDTKLIKNLNADYLRGKVPGKSPGDLAVLDANNFIEGLKVDQSNLTGQITEENKVSGSAVELSPTGGLVNNKGLSLSTKCDAGELLAWDGSAWVCTADIAGNSENVNGIVEVGHGGTGQISFTNGQLLIGNNTGGLSKATLTAGANVVITNASGSITIASTAEANTAANVGTGGVGVYRDKTGVTLNFKNVNVASNKLSVTDDIANSEVDLDVVEANITHNNLGGLAVGDPHTQYVFLNGRAGGQVVIGGTGAGDDITFQTTSDGVKGSYILSDLATGLVRSNAGTLEVAVVGDLTAGSNKVTIGGVGAGALIGLGATVDVNEANLTHNNLGGLTIGDPHTQYALLLGRSGGQSLSGGTDANDDLTLQGTTDATRTTSYVNLQPNGGNVGIGTASPTQQLEITKNLRLPVTTSDPYGVIYSGANPFLHNYGTNNAFLGRAGNFALTGSGIIGLGDFAVDSLTSGADNTGIGVYTLTTVQTGSGNTALGNRALQLLEGTNNMAMGFRAGRSLGTGNYNTLVGTYAGAGTEGSSAYSNNTAIGYKSGYLLTTGGNNILLGYQAGDSLTTGASNIIIGYDIDAPAANTSNYLSIGNIIYGDLSSGKVGIGTATPVGLLNVYQAPADYSATPTLSFGDGDTGLYESADDVLRVSVGGTGYFIFNSSVMGINNVNGSAFSTTTPTTTIPGIFPSRVDSDTGIGYNTSNTLSLITGGSSRLYIDSSGRVGVGTTSPGSPLTVSATAVAATAESIAKFTVSDATTAYIDMFNNNSAASQFSPAIRGVNPLNTSAALLFIGDVTSQDSGTTAAIGFQARQSDAVVANRAVIAFSNYDQRLMTILANGNVGIGTATPDFKMDVGGGLRIESANRLYFGGTGAADTLGNLYHDGTDFVFSDTIKPTGYKSSDGTSGLGATVNLTGSDGNPCAMTFKDGLLTSETCP